jgi:hypothetical protein
VRLIGPSGPFKRRFSVGYRLLLLACELQRDLLVNQPRASHLIRSLACSARRPAVAPGMSTSPFPADCSLSSIRVPVVERAAATFFLTAKGH